MQHHSLLQSLAAVAPVNSFAQRFVVSSLANLQRYGSLTPKQVELAERLLAECSAPKGAAPTGRVEVRGIVRTIRSEAPHRRYGYETPRITKCLVEVQSESGAWKLWSTLPAGCGDACVGDTVEFTVNVTPSKDDPSFGIGKRPTNGARVAVAEVAL